MGSMLPYIAAPWILWVMPHYFAWCFKSKWGFWLIFMWNYSSTHLFFWIRLPFLLVQAPYACWWSPVWVVYIVQKTVWREQKIMAPPMIYRYTYHYLSLPIISPVCFWGMYTHGVHLTNLLPHLILLPPRTFLAANGSVFFGANSTTNHHGKKIIINDIIWYNQWGTQQYLDGRCQQK